MAKILAKNPHDVTNTELAALNSTFAKYKNDPLFAEEFATQVGPKKVLTFWAGIADPYVPLPGSTAAALFIAPLAADTATDAVNTLLGQEIDKATNDAESDPLVPSQMTSRSFYG
ncbi:hypothetical protein AB0D42_29820 [Streptomyces sp. NPDC048304]|uniref:hypothetical protein n=1 Tax=Streptomyces sp. NPDC048304 TaxID=3154820 RepID=UPI0033E9B88D